MPEMTFILIAITYETMHNRERWSLLIASFAAAGFSSHQDFSVALKGNQVFVLLSRSNFLTLSPNYGIPPCRSRTAHVSKLAIQWIYQSHVLTCFSI